MPKMELPGVYRLEGKTPVRCKTMLEWSDWSAKADRRVALTRIGEFVTVSTVFLSINHRVIGRGPPLLFETMVFVDDKPSTDCFRTTSWDDAKDMHMLIVGRVKSEILDEVKKLQDRS